MKNGYMLPEGRGSGLGNSVDDRYYGRLLVTRRSMEPVTHSCDRLGVATKWKIISVSR